MDADEPLIYTVDRVRLPLCESPFLEPMLERLGYTDDQKELVRRFARDGYLKIEPPLIDDFETAADGIIERLAPLYRDPNRRVEDAWRFDSDVLRIALSEVVRDTLRLLYGREPLPFQTINFDVGTQQDLHSDLVHFDSIPRRFMCGVWVALEDTDANNGPLLYSPGSQRLDDAHSYEIGLPPEVDAYPHYATYVKLLVEHLGLPVEEAHLKRGEALVWSANLLHGGKEILDPARTRHSQVTHFYFEDCTYYMPRTSHHPGRLRFREVLDLRSRRLATHWHSGGTLDINTQEWVWRYDRDQYAIDDEGQLSDPGESRS